MESPLKNVFKWEVLCLILKWVVISPEIFCQFAHEIDATWLMYISIDFVIFVLIAILRLFEDKLDEWLPNIKILWSVVETVTLCFDLSLVSHYTYVHENIEF